MLANLKHIDLSDNVTKHLASAMEKVKSYTQISGEKLKLDKKIIDANTSLFRKDGHQSNESVTEENNAEKDHQAS